MPPTPPSEEANKQYEGLAAALDRLKAENDRAKETIQGLLEQGDAIQARSDELQARGDELYARNEAALAANAQLTASVERRRRLARVTLIASAVLGVVSIILLVVGLVDAGRDDDGSNTANTAPAASEVYDVTGDGSGDVAVINGDTVLIPPASATDYWPFVIAGATTLLGALITGGLAFLATRSSASDGRGTP